MKIPTRIYKYQPFTTQCLRNLKNQSIYFSSPSNLNDPYDCSISLKLKELSKDQLDEIRKLYLNNKEIPNTVRVEINSLSDDELSCKLKDTYSEVISHERDKFLHSRGISCFSEYNDDLLMWSHYGGYGKGFCLEFDTDYEPFSKSRQVTYSEYIPKIDLTPCVLNKDFNQFFELVCTKSKSWSYEKEWRVFHNVVGTLYTYPAKSLKAIYFGPDIEFESLEIIALIIMNQNPNTTLYEGSLSKDKFQVEFAETNYTPYNDINK